MKARLMTMAAGAMFVGGLANAEFVGLSVEVVDTAALGWDANGYDTNTLITYRVYADFDGADPGDGVTGAANVEVSLSSHLSFFNEPAPAGGDFAPPDLTGPPFGFWANQWDTYLTVGVTDSADDIGLQGTPNFLPNIAGMEGSFSGGTGEAYALNPGEEPQGLASNFGNQVLLMQLTVERGETTGTLDVDLDMIVFVNNTMTQSEVIFDVTLPESVIIPAAIPAPGALAVLGLAGLVGVRRRRRG